MYAVKVVISRQWFKLIRTSIQIVNVGIMN